MPPERQWLRDRAERLILRLRAWTGAVAGRSSPRAQRYLLLGAALAFVLVTYLAVRALPPLELAERWPLLVLVGVVGVPLSMLANAVEYVISGRIVGSRVRLGEAVRVTVLAMAANLLPLPGSLVVRTTALHGLGSGARRAIGATAIVALAWVGVTGLVAGGLALAGIGLAFGTVTFGVGLAVTACSLLLLAGSVERARLPALTLALLATEVGTVILGAARFWLVLVALGFPAGLSQAAALVIAGVAAAATGIFPGGLGLRELLAGVVSPLVGLPAALGVLATAVNRLIEYAVLLPVSLYLGIRRRRGDLPEVVSVTDPEG
jgi:hypothetical protein